VVQLIGKSLSAGGGLKGIRQIKGTGRGIRREKRFGHRSDGVVGRGLFRFPAPTRAQALMLRPWVPQKKVGELKDWSEPEKESYQLCEVK
jgi:hypothetical protein